MELESDLEAEAERQYNQDTGDTIVACTEFPRMGYVNALGGDKRGKSVLSNMLFLCTLMCDNIKRPSYSNCHAEF